MRARNLKPRFFKNADLAVLDPTVRLLFAGLWGLSDRRGILLDDPREIKAELFPYGTESAPYLHGALTVLARCGFIARYVEGGVRIIKVLAFRRHQNPHRDEKANELPEPTAEDLSKSLNYNEHYFYTVPAPEQHSANTMPAPSKHSSSTALTLFPSFPVSLNHESLTPVSSKPEVGVCDPGFLEKQAEPEQEVWKRVSQIRDAYPEGDGGGDWISAERSMRQLVLREEASWDDLLHGTTRYHAHCLAGGKSGTKYVKYPNTFFGSDDRFWSHPWTVKPNGANGHRSAADYAAEEADRDAKRRMRALTARDVDELLAVFSDHMHWKDHPKVNEIRLAAVAGAMRSFTLEQQRTIVLYTLDHNLDHLSKTLALAKPAEDSGDAQRTGS